MQSEPTITQLLVSIAFFGSLFIILPWYLFIAHAKKTNTNVFPHLAKWQSEFDLLDVFIILTATILAPSFFLGPKLVDLNGGAFSMQVGTHGMLLFTAATSAGILIATFLACMLILYRHGTLASIRLTPLPLTTLVGVALKAIILFIPLTYAANGIVSLLVPYSHPLLESLSSLKTNESFWLTVASAVIVAPLTEEFLFRGVLLGFFERIEDRIRYDRGSIIAANGIFRKSTRNLPLFSILASSLIFGLLHWGHGAAWIPLSMLGCALAFLTCRTGNLLPAISVHMALNGFSTYVQYSL